MSQKRESLVWKGQKRELKGRKKGEKERINYVNWKEMIDFMRISEGFMPFGEHRI